MKNLHKCTRPPCLLPPENLPILMHQPHFPFGTPPCVSSGWAPGPPNAGVMGTVGFCCLWVPLGDQTLKGSSLSNLGVPPGRGNCPLTVPLPFDLVYTDYHGLQQMKQHMGLSFKKYR